MSKQTWFYVALAAGATCLVAAYLLFADNKAEVITMVVSGAVAVFAANASGKAKIKELKIPD